MSGATAAGSPSRPSDRTASMASRPIVAVEQRQQRRHDRRVLCRTHRAEALGGEGTRVGIGVLQQREERGGRHADPRGAAARTPRATTGLAGGRRRRARRRRADRTPSAARVRSSPAGTPPPACRATHRRRAAGARGRTMSRWRQPSPRSLPAYAVAPMRPSASAALPLTSGDGSVRSAASGSDARGSPMRPRANAAICRTSGSVSARSATSGSTPSAQADAADRQCRAAADSRFSIGRAGA